MNSPSLCRIELSLETNTLDELRVTSYEYHIRFLRVRRADMVGGRLGLGSHLEGASHVHHAAGSSRTDELDAAERRRGGDARFQTHLATGSSREPRV